MSDTGNSISSKANKPDLDWSQVKETVLMLKLAAAQVEFSLSEGDGSVSMLTDSFTSMADSVKAIEHSTASIFEKYKVEPADQEAVINNCAHVTNKMQQAIIAFQFYDTLVQRLDHVVNSLSKLGDLVSDPQRLYSPVEWCALQDAIRSRYTKANERKLFDAILAGESIEEVMGKMQKMTKGVEEDIELF